MKRKYIFVGTCNEDQSDVKYWNKYVIYMFAGLSGAGLGYIISEGLNFVLKQASKK